MSIHSKKEFADLCGIETKNLSNYITRGNVIVRADGCIDDTVDKNRAFLSKRRSKSNKVSVVLKEIKSNEIETDNEEQVTGTGQTYTESERQLKYLDTIKRQKEIEKLDIEIAKKRGEVVPSELIKPVFLQHNQSILTEFKNGIDEILRVFSKKSSLSVNQIAELKGEMVNIINGSINKAIQQSEKAVEVIISEHSEKRGVGQKS